MPPHLHPRSAATSTLFGATLLASFVVVGIPHVFPCPRPRGGKLDGKTPSNLDRQKDLIARTRLEEEIELFQMLELEADELARQRRECPMPKPRTILGRIFGAGTGEVKGSDGRMRILEGKERR
jgi:cytochrome c oxidase assembly factor 2